MAEYIEKQAVIDAVHGEFDECLVWDASGLKTANVVENVLDTIPPADVRPVVRGRWIPFTSEAAGDIWYCSACGIGFAHHMNFCPHCGAYMREEETNGEKA